VAEEATIILNRFTVAGVQRLLAFLDFFIAQPNGDITPLKKKRKNDVTCIAPL
jgi:hypothetical protein